MLAQFLLTWIEDGSKKLLDIAPMMDIQGPPLHYPNSHESTDEIYRTRRSSPHTSTSSSPRYQLPAYAEEGAPPQYQEEDTSEKNGKRDGKRTILIRLLTSLFIAIIVALIVAAVFGKINEVQGKKELAQKATEEEEEMLVKP